MSNNTCTTQSFLFTSELNENKVDLELIQQDIIYGILSNM